LRPPRRTGVRAASPAAGGPGRPPPGSAAGAGDRVWWTVGAGPTGEEADRGAGAAAESAVPAGVADRDRRAGLGVRTAPELGDPLAVGEGPVHRPAGDRRGSGV